MFFFGLGTGLARDDRRRILEPMELGHLPYKKATFENYVGIRGLKRLGRKKWRKQVEDVVERLAAAMEADEIVLGGGNVKNLKELPPHCREGDNDNAFVGGFRLWGEARADGAAAKATAPRQAADNPDWRVEQRLDLTRHLPLLKDRSCKSKSCPMAKRPRSVEQK